MEENRRIGDIHGGVGMTNVVATAQEYVDQRVVSQLRSRVARSLRRIAPDAQQFVNRNGGNESVVVMPLAAGGFHHPFVARAGEFFHRARRFNLASHSLRKSMNNRLVSTFNRIVEVQLMQVALSRNSDR